MIGMLLKTPRWVRVCVWTQSGELSGRLLVQSDQHKRKSCPRKTENKKKSGKKVTYTWKTPKPRVYIWMINDAKDNNTIHREVHLPVPELAFSVLSSLSSNAGLETWLSLKHKQSLPVFSFAVMEKVALCFPPWSSSPNALYDTLLGASVAAFVFIHLCYS